MHNDKIGITIDEIDYLSQNQFLLRIIPDFKSSYFIPAHMRHFRVPGQLLETPFLKWINENHIFDESYDFIHEGKGSVRQGGYYLLPKRFLTFKDYEIMPDNYDIFYESKSDSPHDETSIVGKNLIKSAEMSILNVGPKLNSDTYLYGIYVGQGDMLLLITAEKNAYLIDTNIYSDSDLHTKIKLIKDILNKHNINNSKIKGLIITHKHSDHIRGANKLIDSGMFEIDYFIMNLDYKHSTPLVSNLCSSARRNILNWVNLNDQCELIEGQTMICFRNPDDTTKLAPDINDSSIVMCIRHQNNLIHLTGDAHAPIIEKSMNCKRLSIGDERLLKVSHHGSRTGTNDSLISILNPSKAFISAGFSRKYNHPHKECTNLLYNNSVETIVSKNIRRTVEYHCTGVDIIQAY